MPLKMGGMVDWFAVKKLHGVRLFVFTHFLGRANPICCDGQSDSELSVQSLAYAQFLPAVFIVVPLQ
jgi:hypothetical protein